MITYFFQKLDSKIRLKIPISKSDFRIGLQNPTPKYDFQIWLKNLYPKRVLIKSAASGDSLFLPKPTGLEYLKWVPRNVCSVKTRSLDPFYLSWKKAGGMAGAVSDVAWNAIVSIVRLHRLLPNNWWFLVVFENVVCLFGELIFSHPAIMDTMW